MHSRTAIKFYSFSSNKIYTNAHYTTHSQIILTFFHLLHSTVIALICDAKVYAEFLNLENMNELMCNAIFGRFLYELLQILSGKFFPIFKKFT